MNYLPLPLCRSNRTMAVKKEEERDREKSCGANMVQRSSSCILFFFCSYAFLTILCGPCTDLSLFSRPFLTLPDINAPVILIAHGYEGVVVEAFLLLHSRCLRLI